MGRKVEFAGVFTYITRRVASIPTAEMTAIKVALKEIHKNHLILNLIYDILVKFQTQDKKIVLHTWELKEMKKQIKQQNKQ